MSFENLVKSIKSIDSPAMFLGVRASALENLEALELPHRRIENWKYTNLRSVFENDYAIQAPNKESKTQTELSENFHHMVFENGRLISIDKEIESIITIEEAFKPEDFSFETYFKDDFASILNASSLNHAHKLKVKKGSILSKPIFIHRNYTEINSYNNYNAYIEIDVSSELDFLEEITTVANCLINQKTIIKLAKNSKIGHTVLQNTDITSNIFLQISAQVERDAYYSNNIINIGAALSRTNIYGELVGENSELDAHGLYLLDDGQHHDTMSYIRHISPRSYSHQLYKGVLDGKSRGVFSGIIRIERDAQEVAADQLNKNLLLSTKAQANSRPQLEIYADDVKCAHGSTTGQLNEDELFYFESRGITLEKAQQILSKAFVFDVILKIKNLAVRSEVSQRLIEKKKVH